MIGFQSSILAGTVLVRSAIQSPDFVTGVSGWSINQDGTVEFNNGIFRGTLTANSITNTSIGDSTITNSDFQGGTIEDTAIILSDQGAGYLVCYAATVTVSTFAASGNYLVPGGVNTLKVECWGGGAGGTYGFVGSFGGGAGGGGEYAAELALAVTPGNSYAYTVGAGGLASPQATAGRPGGDSDFVGDVDGVFASGGYEVSPPGTSTSFGGFGGFGSVNSIHFDGGDGGNGRSSAGNGGGGGGGGSGGTSANGHTGGSTSTTAAGAGASAVAGGGAGGAGAAYPNSPASAGSVPGGGGGGGSNVGGALGGNGARGQVRVTATSAATLIASVSPTAFTDQYGNNIPAGMLTTALVIDDVDAGRGYRAGASSTANSAAVTAETAVLTISGFTFKAGRAYCVEMGGGCSSGTATQLADFRVKKSVAGVLGATFTEFYRFQTTTANLVFPAFARNYVKNNTGSDITTDVALTLQSAGASVSHSAGAGRQRYFYITDVGAASNTVFANATVVS